MRVAVDVGGTFTDAIGLKPDGTWRTGKTLTTPERLSAGFLRALEESAGSIADIEFLVHGTTVVLNAVLTGSYPRTALVTTAGFRDVLEIMRGDRTDLFDISQVKPVPLVPRPLRFEVEERIAANGDVVTPIDRAALEVLVEEVVASGVDAVAICLLYSFANPAHEDAVAQAFRDAAPDLHLSVSHRVLPVFREFERTSTTVVNALALPLMTRYVGEVLGELDAAGFHGEFAIMQSSGGLVDPAGARRRPVSTLFSGPAGGVICAQEVGRSAGFDSVINFDMGGTSCDVAAVAEGEPDRVTYFQVSGYPVQVPSLDIVSVGAGGGSIAWIDPGGALQVGPQSAGAEPGPACYARGGRLPTVTDAAVVLGRYSASAALGGALPVHRELAVESLRTVAEPLGLSVEEAAWGVLRLVNANMANALREVSVERGRDPRAFALVAAGGGGAAHAFEIAQELGMETILVPPFPGVASAQGMLLADVRHEQARTIYRLLEELEGDELAAYSRALMTEVTDRVNASAVKCDQVTAVMAADLRYRNQTYELTVPMSVAGNTASLAQAFHGVHRARYGHAFDDAQVELINLRAAAVGVLTVKELGTPSWMEFPETVRSVYWGPTWGWLDTPVLSRGHVIASTGIRGPAVIEQSDATVVVPPAGFVEPVAGGTLKISAAAEPDSAQNPTTESQRHA